MIDLFLRTFQTRQRESSMRNFFIAVFILVLMFSYEAYGQTNIEGEWLLSVDVKLNGVVEDPVNVFKFNVTGPEKSFTGKLVDHEDTFKCTLYTARGINLIQMLQSGPDSHRLYSGQQISPTIFQGTFHGVGFGLPGLSGDWVLKKALKNPAAKDVNYVSGFEGDWQTNWGIVTFKVDGVKVTGTYPHDKGRIDAGISSNGKTMEGTWSEAPSYDPTKDAGRVIFNLMPDGTIKGHWWYGQDQYGGKWSGIKIR